MALLAVESLPSDCPPCAPLPPSDDCSPSASSSSSWPVSSSAPRAVDQRAVAPRRRTVTVHAAGHAFTLPASASRVTADVNAALAGAVAQSRKGWLGARVLDGLTGEHVDESIS